MISSLSLRCRSNGCLLGILVLLVLLASSCLTREKRLNRTWKKNPSFQIEYWGTAWKELPLPRRASTAPAELLEKIRIENEIQGFDERPEPAPPLPEITAALDSIITSLPDAVRDLLEERLVGVFCVQDLGGTGYADVVYDEQGQEHFGLIVLDVDVLQKRTANNWATWKERGFFQSPSEGEPAVEVRIEVPENDTLESAVRFILLHELGHILGMVSRAHPSWIDWMDGKPLSSDDPFVKLSWQPAGESGFRSRFDDRFPQRAEINAYRFDRSTLPAGEIPETYRNLVRHTNFPSLSAAQSPWEDFAESFATYVHVELDGRPLTVTVVQEGYPDLKASACWGYARCAEKERFMRRWMNDPFLRGGAL